MCACISSGALASYRAFIDALNQHNRCGGDNGHKRYSKSSFQSHFGAFGIIAAVGSIFKNEKAKNEGKEKADKKERKVFRKIKDVFSTLVSPAACLPACFEFGR